MSYTGNKVFNIYINSANRNSVDKSYDFNIYFDNDEINVNPNEGVNVNVVSFSLLNSMYNVNQYTGNNTFILLQNGSTNTTITIPYGNYSVYSFTNFFLYHPSSEDEQKRYSLGSRPGDSNPMISPGWKAAKGMRGPVRGPPRVRHPQS